MSELGQKLIATVREVVAERPDYIYEKPEPAPLGSFDSIPACVYVRDGQPSCLIGHALWRLGIIDASLSSGHNNLGISREIPGLESLSREEIEWLANVQLAQDTGSTWAAAVVHADSYGDDNE